MASMKNALLLMLALSAIALVLLGIDKLLRYMKQPLNSKLEKILVGLVMVMAFGGYMYLEFKNPSSGRYASEFTYRR